MATEKACRRCGAAVNAGMCKPCWAAYIRLWRSQHPERCRELNRRHAASYRENEAYRRRLKRSKASNVVHPHFPTVVGSVDSTAAL